jgi:hypothetical protein
MLHLIILVMTQYNQSFSCSISHTFLACPPQCRSLDHLEDTVDRISHRPLIDNHMYMLEIRVPLKQPRGSNEKQGLAISKREEQCPQSSQEIASKLTITMRFHRHDIPKWWSANVLPCRKLPCHLEKEKENESK